MTRFLTCICVLVGTALTVAAGSDTPAPAPQHGEAKSQPQQGGPATLAACVFSASETATDERGEERFRTPTGTR